MADDVQIISKATTAQEVFFRTETIILKPVPV